MNRRIKLIFTASILLNIVLLGIGAGLFYRFCMDAPIPAEVSPEARHFIAKTFQDGRTEIRPLIDNIKADRKSVEAIITAEKFDQKAYAAAVDEFLDSRDKIGRKKAEIMGRALAELSAEDRQKFSKRVLERLEGRKPYRKGDRDKYMKDKEKTP